MRPQLFPQLYKHCKTKYRDICQNETNKQKTPREQGMCEYVCKCPFLYMYEIFLEVKTRNVASVWQG